MRLAACIILVAAFLLGVTAVISAVGKPRKPLTGGTASGVFIANLIYALLVVYLYLSGGS